VGLIPALALLLGAWLGLTTGLDAWTCAWLLPPLCVCSAALLGYRAPRLAVISLVLGFAAGGAALAADAREHALHSSLRDFLNREFGGFLIESAGPGGSHDPVPTRAVLLEDAARRDGFVSLRARVIAIRLHGAWQQCEGGTTISVSGTAADSRVAEWRGGRTIEAPITYRRPARYLNAGVPDFERDLALDGVTLLASVKSGLSIDVIDQGGLLAEWAGDVRAHVRRAVARWIESYDAISAAIALAVLIGDRTGLPDDTREALQAAGTYHVIAISGGNIAILAVAATVLLLLVGVRGRSAAAVAIVVLSAYAVIVTAGPSVWRATLMATLYFVARAVDHRGSAWQTTAVAAAVMIAAWPLDVRDAGFILTFGATLALLGSARMSARITVRPGAVSWIAASVIASMAIEVALLPVSATLFSRVTGAGLVLNLLAVPLMGVVQIAALVTAVCSDVAAIAGPSGWLAHIAAQALVGSAHFVTLAPWSTARVPPPGALVTLLYYAAVAMLFFSRRTVTRGVAAVVCLGSMLVVAGIIQLPPARATEIPGLRLTIFDVGQGESMLIELPSGRRMLVDAGGAPFGGSLDIGARVLAPALWARSVSSLDTMAITHGDPDHIGGAIELLDDFRPRHLLLGVPVPNHRPTQQVQDAAVRLGIPIERERTGDVATDGDLRIRVLHPSAPDWERRRVRNDDSVVLELVYGDVALLLTGDISASVEREILPRLTPATTRILKVAHHGSRTSTSQELLSAWRPQFALISVGRGNTFGHPAPEVIQRLEASGATVLRTDLHGQITLETDGHEVVYGTYEGQMSKVKGQK
jgi:competence protein ComEC